MKKHIMTLSIVVSILLSGCTVLTTEYKKPDVDQYKQYSIEYNTSEWWKKLNNQEINSLIENAKQKNLDIKKAELSLKISKENIESVEYSILPSINASINKNTQKTEDKMLKNWSATMSILSYEIDYLNKKGLAKNIADSNYETEKIKLSILEDLIAYSIATEYLKIKSYDNQLLMMTKKSINLKQLIDIYKKRTNVGLDTEYSYTDYILQEKTIESDMNSIKKQRNASIKTLRDLLDNKDFDIDVSFNENNIEYKDMITNVPSTVLENRLDVKTSELNLKIQNANIGLAKAAFFPKIALTSNIGLQSNSLSNLTSSSTLWQIKPEMTYNIFNGMSDYINYQNSKTEYEKLLIDYVKTVKNAFLEVEYNIQAYQMQDDVQKSRNETVLLANKKYLVAQEKRKIGLTSIKEELMEENLLINEQILREKAVLDKNMAAIVLLHSLI